MRRVLNLIGGALVEPASGRWLDVHEPATGQVVGAAPMSGASDVEAAVVAAERAFPGWSQTPAAERSRLLVRLAELIERDAEHLARAESVDTGKPIALARRVDVPRSAANFRFFAGAILHAESQLHDMDGAALHYTLRRPRGVAGLISPWNLPLYLLTWKIAPAIATGNTCVCKPSEVTPTTAHLLAELVGEAGLPPGVVNIVHGLGAEAGAALVQHPRAPTISFTGSTAVGRWIGEVAGRALKRVSLELGGKNPNVIFADADLDAAIDAAARAAFTNQGQICLCGSRVLVERSALDRVLGGLVERADALIVGDPLDTRTQFGALVSEAHLGKVESAVERARGLGARVERGGRRASVAGRCAHGWFYEPTVLTGLDPGCDVEQEEIFGPVVSVRAFDTEAEAIALANGTPYGLASMVWTNDLRRAHRVAAAIDAGIVWVNCWMVRDLRTPFGGAKQSGVGREGGWEALRFFTEPKNVCIDMAGGARLGGKA